MRPHFTFIPLFIAAVLTSPSPCADWPQFRGPGGQGHSDAKDLPTSWSETKNIVWKVPIPGSGHSSPVIADDQIWLTTATADGKVMHALCVAFDDGALRHDVKLFEVDAAPKAHGKNSHATPTPVVDGDHVYVHFGATGTASLARKSGDVVWKVNDLTYKQPYAAASSPMVYGDFLILNCDGTDAQFVVALEKATGDVAWKTPRAHLEALRADPDQRFPDGFTLMAYATPLVIDVAGVPQLISPAAEHVAAYDARTGEEIWWLGYSGFSEVARPVYAHGTLIILGFEEVSQRTLFAVRPGGRGDVGSSHLAWKRRKSVPHVPSPLVVGDELYLIGDGGVATCLDVRTGDEHWQARIGGNFSASPVYADGKIYLCSEEGKTSVLTPGKTHRTLAVNELEGRLMASPAVVGGSLILRTETHLYRIEKRLSTSVPREEKTPGS